MPGRFEFEFTKQAKQYPPLRSDSDPMHILILGDFSGHGLNTNSNQQTAISQRKPYSVDLDSLSQVFRQISPLITIDLGENHKEQLSFTSIDDFHPDSLYLRVSSFNQLRDLRKRLHQLETYPEAAGQLRTLLSLKTATASEKTKTVDITEPENLENDAATLERLLGKPATSVSQIEQTTQTAVAKLIEDAFEGLILPETDVGQQVYIDAAEQALSKIMRIILHHPDFQRLESAWRSVEFLISRVEHENDIQLSLLNISKSDLIKDFRQSGAELDKSELYHLLVEKGIQIPGSPSWSLLIGLYSFDHSEVDIMTLAFLGQIGSLVGGPFLAQANTNLMGCNSLVESPYPHEWAEVDSNAQQRWQVLRSSPAAQWIGLALPRILLRLPYGQDIDEIESFKFQEILDPGDQSGFLWGNPAIGCALLIAQAFTERGWKMTPGDLLEFGDLPAYSYQSEGEIKMLPCAEVYLTEKSAEKILKIGLMPMISLKNSNNVRLLRFQSIAAPATSLAGAWV